jgi:hypothetical protein
VGVDSTADDRPVDAIVSEDVSVELVEVAVPGPE